MVMLSRFVALSVSLTRKRHCRSGWTTPGNDATAVGKAVDWAPVQELPANAPAAKATLSLHQFTPIRSVGKRHPVAITTAGQDAQGNTVYVLSLIHI